MKLKRTNCKKLNKQNISIVLCLILSVTFFISQSASVILTAEVQTTESANIITDNNDDIEELEKINDDDLNVNTDISNTLSLTGKYDTPPTDNNSKQNEDMYSDNSSLTAGNSYTDFQSGFDSCLAMDKSHNSYFYSLNSTQSDNYPISFYLILTLCALDKYKMNDLIKSPKDIENVNDRSLTLKSKTDYPLDYLLYAILLKQSDSAVITLSEALSSNEDKLIKMLNKKAELLKLSYTQFNYISLKDPENRSNLSKRYRIDEQTQLAPFSATSSTSDIARLYRALINNSTINTILSKAEYSYSSKNILNLFTNPFSIIWSLYPNEIINALSYEDANIATYICNLKFAGFDCLIMLNKYLDTNNSSDLLKDADYYRSSIAPSISDQKKEALNEISDLREAIRENWLTDKLFSAGEEYKETINVGSFEVKLKFLNDIYYIHPIHNNFISSEDFSLNKPKIKLPIKSGDKLAQLKITLENKKVINADLYAKDNYRISNEFLDRFLPTYQKYRGICLLIISLILLFLVLIIYRFMKFIFRPLQTKRR